MTCGVCGTTVQGEEDEEDALTNAFLAHPCKKSVMGAILTLAIISFTIITVTLLVVTH